MANQSSPLVNNFLFATCYNFGSLFINFLAGFFGYCQMLGATIKEIATFRFYKKQFFGQVAEIFFFSLPVIFLTSFFTGAVLTLQTDSGLGALSSTNSISQVISFAVATELAPVMAGLMIAGRIGSAVTAQISTMKNSDQINALVTLSIDPHRYLTAPRILAGVVVMPILLLLSDIIGFLGSAAVIRFALDMPLNIYLNDLWIALSKNGVYFAFITHDIVIGMVKACAFGLVITSIGAYFGYMSQGGASGVGKSTTNSVVVSSIFILIVNYLITILFV